MEEFVEKGQDVGLDHMEWDKKLEKFVKTDPAPAPLMTVRVKVLSQVQKHFLKRKTWLWTRLGRATSIKEKSLKDKGAMVYLSDLETNRDMGLQVDMLAKTRVVVKGVKGSRLTVLARWRLRSLWVTRNCIRLSSLSEKPNG